MGRTVTEIGSALAQKIHVGPGLDGRDITPIGWWAHQQGVERLQRSFEAVPKGQRVRPAKKTSNLFRSRAGSEAGLDVSGLTGVIDIDPVARTADVQGMCTYEDLVDATLAYGLLPTVVPQLRTITLGGAVTGMGVESSCFRLGLPHEAVTEMDVLTGTGEILTSSPTQNPDLYRAFPNSYGSLGYAVRLRITLEKVPPFVALRYVRFDDAADLAHAIDQITAEQSWEGERVDYVDGVAFALDEMYLVLGRGCDDEAPVSDYTRDKIFYRALQHPRGTTRDWLTIHDYIWRWDTDWFWCSRAFGTQNPKIRRFWPRDLRRSSVYWKFVALDRRFSIDNKMQAHRGLPDRERVVQDIEVTSDRLKEFLTWFFTTCEVQPVWLCPIRLREGAEQLTTVGDLLTGTAARSWGADRAPWPLYPLEPGAIWVNVGFWSTVPVDLLGPNAPEGAFNRAIEDKVEELGGHKSLYSEAFYDRATFESHYGGKIPEMMKEVYDPAGRFPTLYDKAVTGKPLPHPASSGMQPGSAGTQPGPTGGQVK